MKLNDSAKDNPTKCTASAATLLVMLLFALGALQAQAQVPGLMNYQGRLVDVNGVALPDGDYQIAFRIFNDPSAGTLIWGPFTVSSVPVVSGFFNVVLGPNDAATRPLSAAFSGANAYLEIQVTNGPPLLPRQQILTAPYALKSQDSVFLGGTNWSAIFDSGNPATGNLIASKIADGSITDAKLNPAIGVWTRSGSIISYTLGNVGIGTTTPASRLQVNGTITASTFSGNGSGLTSLNAANLTGSLAGSLIADGSIVSGKFSGNIGVWNKSSSIISYSGGNVGIGTATPSTPLQVNGTVSATAFTGNGAGLTALSSANLTGDISDPLLSDNVALENIQNTFTAQQVFNANVGIGVGGAAPSHLLTIGVPEAPIESVARLGIYNSGTADMTFRSTANDVELAVGTDGSGERAFIAAMTDNPLVFRAGNGSGSGNVEYLRIAPGGNVGIGTTSPDERLDIGSGKMTASSVALNQIGAPIGQFSSDLHSYVSGRGLELQGGSRFNRDFPSGNIVATSYDNPSITMARDGLESSPARIQYSHENDTNRINILAADFEPGRKVFLPAISTGSGAPLEWLNGEMVRDTSSLRYKENVQKLRDEFENVLKLEPKRYTRKDSPGRTEVGYIAEEVDAAGLQSLTVYDEHGKPDAINYGKIVIYSNEVLKQHQHRIQEQQDEIKALREQLHELRNLVLRGSKTQE